MRVPVEKESAWKLGLGLSGGGFRASLFHIGVLCHLAELDLLRSVEVISCVSGGSIIGAFYYLHLKNLLESKDDAEIFRDDYIRMMKTVESDFLSGVQLNVRMRAFSDFGKNLKMFRRDYSRSDRMAELYDEIFFSRPAGQQRVPLSSLKIQPLHGPDNFHPRKHNGNRRAKVPMLILNATTLNTGRNWQFTAVDMGEREPQGGAAAFDTNFILPAFRFDDEHLPDEKYRHVPLSIAVAASACVPGIFHPLALTNLYPDVTPQLVDGGVQDNQGLSALLFEECSDIIISDASGQLQDLDRPGTGFLSLTERTNSVLMARVRELELESILLEADTGGLRHERILHLREGMSAGQLRAGERRDPGTDGGRGETPYGIDDQAQRLLSEVRTDLDSFSEIEAFSLMYSGYRMARWMIGEEFDQRAPANRHATRQASQRRDEQNRGWRFLAIAPFASGETRDPGYTRQLEVAKQTLFKAFRLRPGLIPLGILIAVLSVAPSVALVAIIMHALSISSGNPLLWEVLIPAALLVTLLGGFVRSGVMKPVVWDNVIGYCAKLLVACSGSLFFYLYVRWIDPRFLRNGTIARLSHRAR